LLDRVVLVCVEPKPQGHLDGNPREQIDDTLQENVLLD
jgi:hypothetical protein